MNDTQNSTSASEPRKRMPGDNPNKLNAKPRKGNRPRTQNSSSAPTKPMYKWIDPLPVVEPSNIDLQQTFESIPSGDFDVRPDLPSVIAQPFCSAFSSVACRTIQDENTIERVPHKIEALCYYKAAKQLYATMTDPEKSACQPLKSVYYDSSEVPAHMASALGMIGHIESQRGTILMRNAPTVMKRWIIEGLSRDPDSDIYHDPAKRDDYQDASNIVFPDTDGHLLVQRKIHERISELQRNTYTLKVDDVTLRYTIPDLTGDYQTYYDNIIEGQEYTDELKDLASLIQLTRTQWCARNDVPNNRPLDRCLLRVNLRLAEQHMTAAFLREQFEFCMSEYLVRDKSLVEGFFLVAPAPSTSHGFSSQLVTSEGNVARTVDIIPDSDMMYGLAYNPCTYVEIKPRVVAYSRRTAVQARHSLAAKDLTQVGI
jgi:hypothetical protein